MKKEPLITIIIPVFDVAEYLPVCIESVISQAFKDFEMILVVSDESRDGCPSLCDGYAAQDSRITAVHKKGGGVSEARNEGMLQARGKYLLFIDGDDFIAEGSLEALAGALKKDGDADVVFLNAARYFPEGCIRYSGDAFKKNKLYGKSKKDALGFVSSMSDFNTSVCLKLIRREILLSNDIFFAENITLAEDTDFSLKLFLHAQTYNYCDSYIYFYRKKRKDSATYNYSEKKYEDLLYVISKWAERANEDPDCTALSEEIYRILAFQYCLLLKGYRQIGRASRRKYEAETKNYAWLLKKTMDGRVSAIKWFYRFFGIGLTSLALTAHERFAW